MDLRERGDLDRIIHHEGRLDEPRLDELGEDKIEIIPPALRVARIEAPRERHAGELLRAGAPHVRSHGLMQRVEVFQPAPRRREIDLVLSVPHGRSAEYLAGERGEELLDERHHVGVIPVRRVAFEHREFGIVRPVHPLVAEILRELEHALHPADDEALEIELVRDAEIEIDVERVVMRDERARERPAVERLQDRGLDLDEAALDEKPAHRLDDPRPREEGPVDVVVHDEIDVAPPVAQLLVLEPVPFLGERIDRLAEKLERRDAQRQLARLRPEDRSRQADDVPHVDELEYLELARAHLVVPDIELELSARVLDMPERGMPVPPQRHDAPGERDRRAARDELRLLRRGLGRRMRALEPVRVRNDAHLPQPRDLRLPLFPFLAARRRTRIAHVTASFPSSGDTPR